MYPICDLSGFTEHLTSFGYSEAVQTACAAATSGDDSRTCACLIAMDDTYAEENFDCFFLPTDTTTLNERRAECLEECPDYECAACEDGATPETLVDEVTQCPVECVCPEPCP